MSHLAVTEIAGSAKLDTADTGPAITLKQLAPVLCILLATRLIGATGQSLWFDEGYTLALASAPSVRAFLHVFAGFTTSEHLQPLYYWLMFVWSKIAGTSDFAMRLPSALFSVFSGMLVFAFARNLVMFSRTAAWFPYAALVAYCLSSFSTYYAQEARPYALLQFACFSVLYLWQQSRHAPSNQLLLCVACTAAALTSPFGVIFVFSLSFADLLLDTKQWQRRWMAAIVSMVSIYALYFAVGRILLSSFVARDVVAIRQPLWMNAAYVFFGLFFGVTLGPPSSLLHHADKAALFHEYWRLALLVFCSLAATSVGVFGILSSKLLSTAWLRVLATATLINCMALFVVFGALGHLNVLPRHASGLFAMVFLLCLGCALQNIGSKQFMSLWLNVGLVGVLCLNVVSLWTYRTNPLYRKDDYRAAASFVRTESAQSTEPIFLVAGDPQLFHHYGASMIDATLITPDGLSEFVRSKAVAQQPVELVVNQCRGYLWDNSPSPAAVMQPYFQCTTGHQFSFIKVMECVPKAPASSTTERPIAASTSGIPHDC